MKQIIALLSAALMLVLPPLAAADDLQSELTALEKSLWTAETQKDAEAFRKVMSEDAVQITAGGTVTGREAIAKDATSCDMRSFTLHDVKMHQLTPDVVALHYTATQDAICNGKQEPAKVASTAIWQKQKGKWVNAIYQSTPIK